MEALHCPNCGRIVGESSPENDYQKLFYFHDKQGEPICPTCGGATNIGKVFAIVMVIISLGCVLGAIFS